jgi:methionine aminotransferase
MSTRHTQTEAVKPLPASMRFDSKLPDVGTTIFTVMSRRAIEEGALNIGQGFPDYPIDPRLAQSLVEAVSEGHNQYAPMEGVIALRELIAAKLEASYGISVDAPSEITVTCGATEALYDAIQAVIGPGDEAIIFDPAYDAYEPSRTSRGRAVRPHPADAAGVRVRLGPHTAKSHAAYAPGDRQQSAESELHRRKPRRSRFARRAGARPPDQHPLR